MHPADSKILKTAALPTAGLGCLAIALGGLVAGSTGALGAAVATAIVLTFFSIGQATLSGVLRRNPSMALNVALMIYLAKVALLLVFLLIFKDTTAFDTQVFGITILLLTLTWTGAEVWVFSRMNVLVVNDGQGSQSGDEIANTLRSNGMEHQ